MKGSNLYAVRFSDGTIKVGRGGDAQARIASHASRLGVAGISVVEAVTEPCLGDVVAAERALLQRCSAAARFKRAAEWFVGLDFAEVHKWLREAASVPAPPSCATSRLYYRRDSYPLPSCGGYICRSCCRVHDGRISSATAFLCSICVARGYRFDKGLSLDGQPVALWSGIEPGTEVRAWDGVACEELRPSAPWFRVADPDWSLGRPVVDYTRGSDHPAPKPEPAAAQG